MAVWKSVADKYNYIFDELSNPLTKDWLLLSSPLPILAILLVYNVFCAKIGPMLMKNRKPYNLETPIKIYNILQVFLSLYLSYEGCIYLFSGDFNFRCQGIGEGNERVARAFQFYLFTKLIELLDTIFFVFRKSERQITFLHLYHHTLMPIVTWAGLKWIPGGQGVLGGTINSIVHVFMYMYYLLTSFGPQYQKHLWWKKYLTIMQIVQFFIVLLHSFNSTYYECNYPYFVKILTMGFSLVFLHMFGTFYYVNYIMRKPILQKGSNTNGTKQDDKRDDNYIINGKYTDNKRHDVNEDKETNFSRIKVAFKNNINGSSNDTNNVRGKHLTINGKIKDK